MGCRHSKHKKSKKDEKDVGRQDGAKRVRRVSSTAATVAEKRLASLEGQLKILKETLLAGDERAELLKEHAHEEACALVLAIVDQVKMETSARLDAVHQQQRQQTELRHQQHLHEVERDHKEVKVQLTESFRTRENALKAELEHYDHLKRRVQESTFKCDLLRNIQAHGSPGAFWESEQESLLFVIEMKSERLRELNERLGRMGELAEEKSCAEARLLQNVRENEDLKVRLDKNQSFLKRACAEREEARTSRERLRLLNEALTREKEQLLFKFRHGDAGQAPPPTTPDPEESRGMAQLVGVSK
ncbi:coiled-coil domain-containing protein 69 [Stigmatopora argus]